LHFLRRAVTRPRDTPRRGSLNTGCQWACSCSAEELMFYAVPGAQGLREARPDVRVGRYSPERGGQANNTVGVAADANLRSNRLTAVAIFVHTVQVAGAHDGAQ
jgi:hypothetical protein